MAGTAVPAGRRGRLCWVAIALLVAAELLSAGLLGLQRFTRKLGHARSREPIDRRDGVEYGDLHAEMDALYRTAVRHHPYRWYALPANFRGEYVVTDSLGFRNETDPADDAAAVWAFFGGSTMFGTGNRQPNTIVSHLRRLHGDRSVSLRNMGVGGYSTSAELALFVETTRLVPGVRVAVFYDGVNEVARYIESRQDGEVSPTYDVLGYPLMDPMIYAAQNGPLARGLLPSRTVELVSLMAERVARSRRSFFAAADRASIERHASTIADIYVENIRMIRAIGAARGIRTMFFWQPDLFTTRKPLTEREEAIQRGLGAVGHLTEAVLRRVEERVRDEPDLAAAFAPITDALDGLGRQDHFYDYCHLSSAGNEAVARVLLRALTSEPRGAAGAAVGR